MVLNSLLQEQDREAETRPLRNKIKLLQQQKRNQSLRLHSVHNQVLQLKSEMQKIKEDSMKAPDCSDLVKTLTDAILKQN